MKSPEPSRAFRDLEILVAKIQSQLAPDAVVLHNTKLLGRISKKHRQIDVLLKKKIGQYEMRVVIECKDQKRPIDVKGIEEFHGLLRDVGAHKGAMVSPRGFTAAAKQSASAWQIELYSPVDTDPHRWQAKIDAPMICDFKRARFSFGLSSSAPMPFRLPNDFWSRIVAYNEPGDELGTPASGAIKKWNEGKFPDEPGEHRDLPIFDAERVMIDNGYGQSMPVDLSVSLFVERQLYFGHLAITNVSGFRDELAGGVITNAFTTGMLDAEEVTRTWLKIKSRDEAPAPPIFEVVGRVGWSDEATFSAG